MTAAGAAAPGRVWGRRGDHGLITLEWLLIVGAIAGLAASTALAVQGVLDDTSEVRVEPEVRFLDAEIAAAAVASEATAWRRAYAEDPEFGIELALYGEPLPMDYSSYEQRCEDLETDFDDVLGVAFWHDPEEFVLADFNTGEPPVEDRPAYEAALRAGKLEAGARCEVTARAGLGG